MMQNKLLYLVSACLVVGAALGSKKFEANVSLI
jgi:hypothetical protein